MNTSPAALTPSANFNRASAGYTCATLLDMLAGLETSDMYYTYPGNRDSDTIIGHRHNHTPGHSARIKAAVGRFRSYGLRVRLARGGASLTVYGPKRGGRAGQYSS